MRDNVAAVPDPVDGATLPTVSYEELTIGEQIGTGGEADVFYAQVTHDGETYDLAVKEPRFDGTINRRVVERFHDEAEVWSELSDHHHIVSVYGWGTEPVPWLAMEYMDGGTLAERIGNAGVAEALWLAGRIADGVHHGHRHGIAHLDLTPANVLLRDTGTGQWPYPKVSDWGLARPLLEDSTGHDGLTPAYAAPEQFDPETYGTPNDFTDIYQLGAVTHALLTGEPPFTGSATQIQESVCAPQTPPPVSTINPAVPDTVDEVVLRALATDRDDRYESAVMFRQALDRLFERVVETPANQTAPTPSEANTGGSPGAESQSERTGEEALPVSRRTALMVLGVGAVGIGGGVLLTQSAPNGTDANAVQPAATGDSDRTNSVLASHSGTHEITATDAYWAWRFAVETQSTLEYTVTNRLDPGRDFDVLLYRQPAFETYQAIATGREDGVRPTYLRGSNPGTTTQATATVELPAGTYYLVVDNTDLSDAGDFGTEATRRVHVEATVRTS